MIIFKYLYTLWAALLFLLFLLLGVVVYFFINLFLKEKGLKYMLQYNHWWIKNWSFLIGVKNEIIGQEKVDVNTAYILVSNHTGLTDALIANLAVKNLFSPLAKIEVGRIPLMGYLFKTSSILVDRKDKESRKQSVVEMRRRAKQNISVFLFPEGTRNKKAERPLLPFHSGAFRLAIELQLPIAPMVFANTRQLLTNDGLPINPCTIKAIYSDPIETKGMTEADMYALKDIVYRRMEALLIEHDPLFKDMLPSVKIPQLKK